MSEGKLKLKGKFHIVHRGVDGAIKSEETLDNLVVTEGIAYILDSAFNADTQISDWYFAPWNTSTAPAAGHTYAVPVNTEATNYDEATRQEWAEGASAGGSITNATPATITASSALTVEGVGIMGGGSAATTKGDTAGGGTMTSSAMFASAKVLATAETLDITYTLTATAS